MKSLGLAVFLAAVVAVGCQTHVGVTATRREDMSAQSKVLAVAARNLEDSMHRNPQGEAEEAVAQAVAQFHTETERFASIVGAWRDDDQVNTQYEQMIEAWVRSKYHFPELKADKLTQEAYAQTAHEWERMHRASGYHAQRYEKDYTDKYQQEASQPPSSM